jgi:hypothetical protein
MRVPLRPSTLTFCGDCGARVKAGSKGCPSCGALIAQPERPIAVIVFVAICALSAVFIAYTMLKPKDDGVDRRAVVTLTELGVSVPLGWQYREVNGAYVMAQYKEDLDVEADEPENLRGPQIRIARERQARTNIEREVMRGVLRSDIADAPRDSTYGQASELLGSEVRFVREGVDADVVGFRYYMTGSNPLGQAYTIAYFVPATLEKRYEPTLKTFLESLSLTEEESEQEP